MKVEEFLSILNMQVKYKVVDRNTKEVFYDTEQKTPKNFDRDILFNKKIYMVFPDKEQPEKLDIRVF